MMGAGFVKRAASGGDFRGVAGDRDDQGLDGIETVVKHEPVGELCSGGPPEPIAPKSPTDVRGLGEPDDAARSARSATPQATSAGVAWRPVTCRR